jgi:hypothetical protein
VLGVAAVARDDDVNGYPVATIKTVQVIDDFDGTILDDYESVQFGIEGTTYDFDTTPKRAGVFRARLQKYVDISRPADSTTPARSHVRVPAAAGGNNSAEQNQAIRDWARANNFKLSDRGRVPAHIVAAFDAAH